MRRIRLPHTHMESSVLGFGCNPLTTLNDRAKALDLLEAALDAGITHFDVARAYGSGHTEGIVGEFLKGKRDRVTITTKFGLRPATPMAGSPGVLALAKRALRLVPAIDRKVRARINKAAPRFGTFGIEESRASLETSLRELRTDYVDIVLLHEGRIADAQNEDLQEFLAGEVKRGTVRAWGIGTHHRNLENDARRLPARCSVVQFENDIVEKQRSTITGLNERDVFTHSSLRPLGALSAAAAQQPDAARAIRDLTGLDVTRRADAARLLLGFALADNPRGVVLFGSTRVQSIEANARLAAESVESFGDPALASAIGQLLPANSH